MKHGIKKVTSEKTDDKSRPKSMAEYEPSVYKMAKRFTVNSNTSQIKKKQKSHPSNPIVISIDDDEEMPPQSPVIELDSDDEEIPPQSLVIELDSDDDEPAILPRQIMPLYQKSQEELQSEIKGIQIKEIKKGKFKLSSKVYQARVEEDKDDLINALKNVEGLDKNLAKQLLSKAEISSFTIDEYFRVLESENKGIKMIPSGFAKSKIFLNPTENLRLKEELKKADRILWPICTGDLGTTGNHWFLLILEKSKNDTYSIYCLDGFNSESRKDYLAQGEKLLQALFPTKELDTLVKSTAKIDIPTQNNGVDCGAVISFWGMKCAKNAQIPLHNKKGSCDYSEFRYDMAETLIAKQNARKVFKP
ncbi:MAG: hypothetical protein J0H47_11930 [Gammaproteobacteria bacterium]|nr:hypothetical protein [Gammaproteobacteria bacterium]